MRLRMKIILLILRTKKYFIHIFSPQTLSLISKLSINDTFSIFEQYNYIKNENPNFEWVTERDILLILKVYVVVVIVHIRLRTINEIYFMILLLL